MFSLKIPTVASKLRPKILTPGNTPRDDIIPTTTNQIDDLTPSYIAEEMSIEEELEQYNLSYGDISDDVEIQICKLDYLDEMHEDSDKRLDFNGIEEELAEFHVSDYYQASRKANHNYAGSNMLRARYKSLKINDSGNDPDCSELNKDSRSIMSILKNGSVYTRDRQRQRSLCIRNKAAEDSLKEVRFKEMSTVYIVKRYIDKDEVHSYNC